jgi:transposase
MLDKNTGEVTEKRLTHSNEGEEAKKFYSELTGPVLVGLEASGQSQWFERCLAELGHELWIGDAAKIRASTERKQKTDRRDANLLLELLEQERFPCVWVPKPAERDVRQLLLHRAKLVRVRTQVKNQLQALALNQGVQRKRKLWTVAGRKQLESLPLLPWASRRRTDLLKLLDELGGSITALDSAVCQEASARPAVRRLMTHPGVGPVTALAFALTPGTGRAEEVPCTGQSGHGTEVGGAVVLDAARRSGLCAVAPGFLCRTARVISWSWLRPLV